MQASEYVTLVEILELTHPYEEFAPLIKRALERLAVEGVPALRSMHFFHDADKAQLGAVITFSSSEQIPAHTAMISQWEEFQKFSKMVKVVELRVHGKISPEVREWLARFGGPVRIFEDYLGGFVR